MTGLLEGAVLDRITGASVVAKRGLVFGLSIANATGASVASDDTTSVKEFIVGVSAKLPIYETVITVTEATIAMAAMVNFVATDMPAFLVAALAIVVAPEAADAPVEMAAWTAIDCREESIVKGCTMLTISVDLMVRSNYVAIIAIYRMRLKVETIVSLGYGTLYRYTGAAFQDGRSGHQWMTL
jgi:hypothetical protein